MKLLFWIHISSINKKGKAPISMRITIDGQRAELKTNISIEPALWDKEQQCILGSGELIKQYNDRIIGLTSQAWSFYNQGLFVKEKNRILIVNYAVKVFGQH